MNRSTSFCNRGEDEGAAFVETINTPTHTILDVSKVAITCIETTVRHCRVYIDSKVEVLSDLTDTVCNSGMFPQPCCRRRVDFVPASIESFWRVQVKRLCPDDFKTVKKRQNRMFHADPKKNAHISKRWFLFSDQKHPHPPVTSQNISSIVFLIQPFPRFPISLVWQEAGQKNVPE